MPDPDRLEARPTLFRRKLETLNAKPETELTARERRWFTQPLWRQAMSVLTIVALVFVTTPAEVQAQTGQDNLVNNFF